MKTNSGKKIVHVTEYTREDGVKVPTHRRSTPNKCDVKK